MSYVPTNHPVSYHILHALKTCIGHAPQITLLLGDRSVPGRDASITDGLLVLSPVLQARLPLSLPHSNSEPMLLYVLGIQLPIHLVRSHWSTPLFRVGTRTLRPTSAYSRPMLPVDIDTLGRLRLQPIVLHSIRTIFIGLVVMISACHRRSQARETWVRFPDGESRRYLFAWCLSVVVDRIVRFTASLLPCAEAGKL